MTLLERIVSVIAPHECAICGQDGEPICIACGQSELLPAPSRCYKCFAQTTDFSVCAKCRKKTKLRHVWVRADYEGASAQLILDYKHNRAKAAHKPVVRMMSDTLPLLPSDTVIVAVPTATTSVRQRGFDHALLLARQLAYDKGLLLARSAVRTSQAHQFGANRKTRLKQLQGAFFINKPKQVNGKNILIVDDVVTTGATLETFANALKEAGAKTVSAVVFAQKL